LTITMGTRLLLPTRRGTAPPRRDRSLTLRKRMIRFRNIVRQAGRARSMDFQLSREQRRLQQTVRAFADRSARRAQPGTASAFGAGSSGR
jgi:hypothetical protein